MTEKCSIGYFTTLEGLKMPAMLYGTAWKQESTAHWVELAVRSGFSGIDTACQPKHYQESLVGAALERLKLNRQDIFIQTKFTPVDGQDPNNIPYNYPLDSILIIAVS